MRPAPPVAVGCTGGLVWRAVQTVLPALAAGSLSAFVLLHLERAAWPAWALVGVAALGAWHRARPRVQQLRWDGQVWSVDDSPGALTVMVDVGTALLLRLKPPAGGASRWIAVTRRDAGPGWHALRAAVYSRPSQSTAPRVRPPERTAD